MPDLALMCRLGMVVACMLPPIAHATPPSDADVMEIQEVLGFNGMFDSFSEAKAEELAAGLVSEVLDSSLLTNSGLNVSESERAGMHQELKQCLTGVWQSGIRTALVEGFRDMFESSENIAAWLEFSRTSAGARIIEHFRTIFSPVAKRADRPGMKAFMQSLPRQEKDSITEFLRSPAGSVLRKRLPDLSGAIKEMSDQSFEQCILGGVSEAEINKLLNLLPGPESK